MKVLARTKKGYKEDPTKYFNFKRFAKKCSNFVLIEGAFEESDQWKQFNLSDKELDEIKSKRIVRLEFEEPNKFFIGDNPDNYDNQFYKIFSICPFTAEWLNKRQKNTKHIAFNWPFNEKYIPRTTKKKYDIIYTGHILSKSIYRHIQTMSKFNYRLVSDTDSKLVTDYGTSYLRKMELISQSKITLVTNLLYLRPYHLLNLWRIRDFQKNKAFRLVPKWYEFSKWINKEVIVPQQKSRLFEAAFSRSLILCRKDPFNIIERYFEPGREFVYFDESNLEKTIEYILQNYHSYEKVVERAYNRAINNYTTKKFVEKYLKNLD